MKVMYSIVKDFVVFFNPQTKVGLFKIVLLIVALAAIYFIFFPNTNEGPAENSALRIVTVAAADSFYDGSSATIIGTVEAVNQANLETEASGRITSVNVVLGQSVTAGAVLATLENSSERAALLQAEGAYEAAQAAAAQSEVSVEEAKNALALSKNSSLSSIRSALNVAEDVVFNSFDQFFANPNSQTPGLRLTGTGYSASLNSDRVSLQSSLRNWTQSIASLSTTDDLFTALSEAEAELRFLSMMADKFVAIFNDYDANTYTDIEIDAFGDEFNSLKNVLNNTISELENSRTNLKNSNDTLNRISISGTAGQLSTANAQVKQALGALRSAEANFAKTIVTTPIAGEVNSISVRTGDFVSNGTKVATIANNQALEITAYIGEQDRSAVKVGQEVKIENNIPAIVTAISPAVDPLTRKIELKIATESDQIANGDTVTVTIENNDQVTEVDSQFVIPITAVKFSDVKGFVYTVNNENVIVSHEVELGRVLGSSVEILSGLNAGMEIVVDARGLSPDQEVEAINRN